MEFAKESDFEEQLTRLLTEHGWSSEMLMYKTEKDLVRNWANILYDNNRTIDRLDRYPLTDSEMKQVLDKVTQCGSPYKLNGFINGKSVSIIRDNPDDKAHLGKEIYLKIYDSKEIAGGQSRYQIARQPQFQSSQPLVGNRRGDFMLLINGMPVIHIELKKSGVDVSQAIYQIKHYYHEGIFSRGLFSLVQVFVAMTPEETIYFANPGSEDRFEEDFRFHWADFNNVHINDWRRIASELLSIPMAHQLVGFYTIADDKDGMLKVLRSYQYYAVTKMWDVVKRMKWDEKGQNKGGYIWHTTGSGKTMTSFKAAQLIASGNDADKVVFIMDRIELGNQSLDEYRGFAGESESIQDTDDTSILVSKLKSTNDDDKLIVTSIQKMSRIHVGESITQSEIDMIARKHLVFIFDECHRSVFGSMLRCIKNTFPKAVRFGFTGTPIFNENAHGEITTEDLFGDELHRYTVADGLNDHNVLGFDTYKVNTYSDQNVREIVALDQAKATLISEALEDEHKKEVYLYWMNEADMIEVESKLPRSQYMTQEHHEAVVEDINKRWNTLSLNGKYHAILTTKNIPEAIAYYRLMKENCPQLRIAAVFDDNIDNVEKAIYKQDSIIEMLGDYNSMFGTSFAQPTYGQYKKDVQKRLAHKKPYQNLERSQQINILIVVTQMLTGYDSKWVNTLYADKVMKYHELIQAFSRTNRLSGRDKPFGIIRYYSFPNTMEKNIEEAFKAYSGDRPFGLFVDRLEENLNHINMKFDEIKFIFETAGVKNFERLPSDATDKRKFALAFNSLNISLNKAKLQGFTWDKLTYDDFENGHCVTLNFDEQTYMVLVQRYRELFGGGGGGGGDDVPFPIETYITETGTGTIDAEYMNSKFQKYIKKLYTDGPGSESTKDAVKELHKTFATLSQQDQLTAILILHDIQCGDLRIEEGKTLKDYIAIYQVRETHRQIKILADATGLDADRLTDLIMLDVTEANINEYNRFDNLKASMDAAKAKLFLEKVLKTKIKPYMTAVKFDTMLRSFVLSDIERERIIKNYCNDSETANTDVETTEDKFNELLAEDVTTNVTPMTDDILKKRISDEMTKYFSSSLYRLKPTDVIVNKMFYVLDMVSTPALDGVGMFVRDAFGKIFGDGATYVERRVSFNSLVTKFEAYLKKLYFVLNGTEIKAYKDDLGVTFADAIHAFGCLWGLKNNTLPEYQNLYHYLMNVKAYRNDDAHLAPTATEEELAVAIRIVVTMYLFVTGSMALDIESLEKAERWREGE